MRRLNNLPLDRTKAAMAQFMPFVKQGERVMFLVPAGDGFNMVQRVRVAMSRARKELRRKQKPMIHFRLHHSIMPWTEAGKRHDAVILWSTRDETHEVNELLEDVFRNV